MQSEYGNNEFSNSGRINEEGDYDFNISRDDPNYVAYRKRANYILLTRILPELEGANLVIPSYDVLEGNGIIRDIKPRFSEKTGRFNGFDYRTDPFKAFKRIIVREKGEEGRLRYTGDKTLQPVLKDFRDRLKDARELYDRIADGIIDTEMKWDGYLEGLQIDTNTVDGVMKAKKTKDEIREEMKKGFISQTEENMSVVVPKLLKEFNELQLPERNGALYSDYIRNVMRPISQMTWFKQDVKDDSVYEREISYIRDERADIEERIRRQQV